jgi:hypothetical protein
MADFGYNLLYSNNFVNNKGALHVSLSYLYVMSELTPISPVGNWDNGTIGNYWSDYNTRYPNASKIGDLEAVGDTAYLIESKTTYMFDYGEETVIFGRSFDHYPLIHSINIQTDTDSKSPNSDDQHYLENNWLNSSINISYKYVVAIVLAFAIVITVTIVAVYKTKSHQTHK